MESLSQLFYLHGIGYEYTKYTGEHVVFSDATRSAALSCCGVDVTDHAQIAHLNISLDANKWLQLVPECSLVCAEQPAVKVRIDRRMLGQQCTVSFAQLDLPSITHQLADLQCSGDYLFNDVTYLELIFPLPLLPIGYHDAHISVAGLTATTQLWVTPKYSFQVTDKKQSGLSIQLYSLKNNAALGIGDFADLLSLTEQAASHKLDYILLNPLHLLFSEQPERASPYSPNNRALLNPLYISIDLCDDSINNPDITAYLQSSYASDFKKRTLQSQYINYSAVSEFKYAAFNLLYQHFCMHGSEHRKQHFSDFCQQHGSTLATLKVTDSDFAYYLQWLAYVQLKLCQTTAREQGMSIGLINDLAVGCAGDGSEFLNQQSLFTDSAYVGAPPDPWAEHGQNWGLPALNPIKLSDNNFSYYRELIRANMENVGGLRIDHVMAIRRLWWCFEHQQQQDGCYVYYPFEHLLAVLTIESHLNQCIVIGEDLGVVPPEVKAALADKAIFSNSLFYFEKDYQGEFLAAQSFAPQSLLMVANHDVPPFFGWWQGLDLTLKLKYQLIDEQQLTQLHADREIEKQRLLRFLSGCAEHSLFVDSTASDVYQALTLGLAAAPARLFTIQLDDLDEQTLPVNIPGTDQEYPNWRRVLTHSSEQILTRHSAFLSAINSIRTN
ncbi:4-alpha-glucanotransferase [Pseudoalteromonas sp. SG41-2]|uniref:4-alpha-glucanotransferase n=1 Tax=Pseudoalteromonas sp. SG41-2 TaxID=2760978 RepID=UPI0016025D5B|nr:4-alpha-glucanotransferase [Pseudoalteromonas sp. SG41-2]MBB1479352.1 4-alpha-glucanotransferase [Pseudoalteromonas sp. SG41-2]